MIRIAWICILLFAGLNIGFILPGNNATVGKTPVMKDWSQHSRLTWPDFKGKAETWNNISALTASAIEYSYDCGYGGKVDVTIRAIFFPDESWVKSDARSEYILSHEQLHFDITELHARKLRKVIDEEIHTCRDLKLIEGLAQEVVTEWKYTQKQYDRDTQHSIQKDKQEAWAKKIHKTMKEYDDYGPDWRFSDN